VQGFCIGALLLGSCLAIMRILDSMEHLTVYRHVLHLKWPLQKPNCSTESQANSSALSCRLGFLLCLGNGKGGWSCLCPCVQSFEGVRKPPSPRKQSGREKALSFCYTPGK
jgi:hypothetical protein